MDAEKGRGRERSACAGCRYAVPVYMGDGEDLMTACVYILRTGKKRPCPSGAACTVREPAESGTSVEIQRNAVKMDVYSRLAQVNK